ncbi:hypothetical protein ACCUM_3205 [Candidatus Accumulibacter phosphatis]|uniref:Uncharacterized protein n=1 Tax=Candidatus Accumulibacter phosphatis TaxID=327160 RepID=A0A5S4EPT2_9PROT|nr:hypothetical protein ACCUM_3205 [Candidatus Accumulibacter phosphatis]
MRRMPWKKPRQGRDRRISLLADHCGEQGPVPATMALAA